MAFVKNTLPKPSKPSSPKLLLTLYASKYADFKMDYEKIKVHSIDETLKVDPETASFPIIYCTYTKSKLDVINNSPLKNGKVYIGRCRGIGKSPCQIVKARDANHHVQFYGDAKLDTWVVSTKNFDNRATDPSYMFTRGRENLVMKYLGGPKSDQWRNDKTELDTRSRNLIWGISPGYDSQYRPMNPFWYLSHGIAQFYIFGLDPNWDGVLFDKCP